MLSNVTAASSTVRPATAAGWRVPAWPPGERTVGPATVMGTREAAPLRGVMKLRGDSSDMASVCWAMRPSMMRGRLGLASTRISAWRSRSVARGRVLSRGE